MWVPYCTLIFVKTFICLYVCLHEFMRATYVPGALPQRTEGAGSHGIVYRWL